MLNETDNTTALSAQPSVGDSIELSTRRWSFAGSTTSHFDEHVRKSVPGYGDGHAIIEELSDFFVAPGGRVLEVGCSTGTLISRLARRHAQSGADFLGIDVVEEMVQCARANIDDLRNVRIEQADAARIDYSDATLVVMYYTLQFIPVALRGDLLDRICSEMRPGGALIVFEKTRLPTSALQDMCGQIYESYKAERGFSAEEILGKARSLRGVLEPLTSTETARLISTAGFEGPHVIYKYLAFEGMVGMRPLLAPTSNARQVKCSLH